MEDTVNGLNVISEDNGGNDITIKVDGNIFSLNFSKVEFYDDADKVRFIKKCESMIRQSPEYKDLVKYYKDEVDIDYCSVLNKLGTGDVAIEFHHHPFTLWDYVETEVNRCIASKINFTTFTISAIVMSFHYNNNVGLIPLSRSMHELAHSGGVFLYKKLVFGNYEEYFEQMQSFMEEATLEKYHMWIERNNNTTEEVMLQPDVSLYDPEKRKENVITMQYVSQTSNSGLLDNNTEGEVEESVEQQS